MYLVFIVECIFHNSKKTKSEDLESMVEQKGQCKKNIAFLFVLIAYHLDLTIGINYIRDIVIIGLFINELISIVENAGLIGVELLLVIQNTIDIFK